MAGRGLLGGLPGRAALTAAPGLIAGEGIRDAAETGMANYDADQRQQLQRREVGLHEEEGARAEKRLNMAESLMPAQRQALDLANDERRMNISEAARKAERDKAASQAWETLHSDITAGNSAGKPLTGIDIHARIGDILAKRGEFGHLREWFKDHELLTKPGREGAEAANVMQAWGNAVDVVKKDPSNVKGIIDIAAKARQEHPAGYALVGRAIDKLVEDAVTATAPEPVAKAFRAYQASTIADPKLSKLAAWETAAKDLDPGVRAAFDKLKPSEVAQDEAARGKGKEKAAEEAVTRPGKLKEIEAHTAGQIQVEQAKGKIRKEQVEATKFDDLRLRSDSLGKDVKRLTDQLKTAPYDKRQEIEDQIEEGRSELKMIDGEIQRRRAGGKGDKGAEGAAAERPKGIKATRLREGRDALKAATSMDQVEKALKSEKATYWSEEEINTLRAEAKKRFGK